MWRGKKCGGRGVSRRGGGGKWGLLPRGASDARLPHAARVLRRGGGRRLGERARAHVATLPPKARKKPKAPRRTGRRPGAAPQRRTSRRPCPSVVVDLEEHEPVRLGGPGQLGADRPVWRGSPSETQWSRKPAPSRTGMSKVPCRAADVAVGTQVPPADLEAVVGEGSSWTFGSVHRSRTSTSLSLTSSPTSTKPKSKLRP